LDPINTHTIVQSNFNSLQEVQPQYQSMNPRIFSNDYEPQMENGLEAKPIEDYKFDFEEGPQQTEKYSHRRTRNPQMN
jgi:hypothetical protein